MIEYCIKIFDFSDSSNFVENILWIKIILGSAWNARKSSLPDCCSEYTFEISVHLFVTALEDLILHNWLLLALCVDGKQNKKTWPAGTESYARVGFEATSCSNEMRLPVPNSGWRRKCHISTVAWCHMKKTESTFKASVKLSKSIFSPLKFFRIFYVHPVLYCCWILILKRDTTLKKKKFFTVFQCIWKLKISFLLVIENMNCITCEVVTSFGLIL